MTGGVALREVRVSLRLTKAEFAALEAVRATLPGASQADVVAYLVSEECVRRVAHSGCAQAVRGLQAELRRGRRYGRPPSAPRHPLDVLDLDDLAPAADPRPGERFLHRWWRSRGKAVMCLVVRVTGTEVHFCRWSVESAPEPATHTAPRESFPWLVVGQWLDRESAAR